MRRSLFLAVVLFAARALAEECNPHLTCNSTTPTPNLGLKKVTKGMCNAQTCINASFDTLDANALTFTGSATQSGQIAVFADTGGHILTGINTPTTCAAGQYAAGITTKGAATGCTAIHNVACIRIEDTSTRIGQAFQYFMDPNGATIATLGCYCQGSCGSLATITFTDQSGNTISPSSPLVCSTGTTPAPFVATVDPDRVLAAGEGLRVTATGSPDVGDDYLVCAGF